eukprot:COSAG04_NODE_2258_length_4432_cov_1.870759_4_plen_106_part_00
MPHPRKIAALRRRFPLSTVVGGRGSTAGVGVGARAGDGAAAAAAAAAGVGVGVGAGVGDVGVGAAATSNTPTPASSMASMAPVEEKYRMTEAEKFTFDLAGVRPN